MKKLFSTRVSETTLAFALFILRVGAGSLLMVTSGYDKLQNFASKSASFKPILGLGGKTEFAMLVFAEFFCAAFVIIGLFTRLAAIPIVFAMGVALFVAHHGHFYSEGKGAGLYLVCFLAILLAGPGKFSLDRLISKS